MEFKTLEEIEANLAIERSPGYLAEIRVILSSKYSHAVNQLEAVLLEKPKVWNAMRQDFKSDTACERAFEASELGQKEMHWKFQVKKIEKMMSAIKTLIEVKTGEARNLY